MDPKLLRSPGEETQKILAFRDNLIASKEIKYETFKDVRDYELKLMHAVVAYVQRLVKADREKQQSENQSTPAEPSPSPQVQDQPAPDLPLAAEGAAFLRGFLALTEKKAGATISTQSMWRGSGFSAALSRSRAMTKSRWGRTTPIYFLRTRTD